MKDNRIKNEFAAMEVPDMKTGILAAIRQKKAVSHRRRMRPAAIAVIAAMLALFGITVGAGTSGMLNLQNGSRYSFMDADGNIVKPTGFHLEEGVDVSLSEKARTTRSFPIRRSLRKKWKNFSICRWFFPLRSQKKQSCTN